MSASQPARKRLPVKPSAEHLRKQAKRLARDHQLPLADAQHRLAGEYGARSWADLMHIVETMLRGADQLVGVKYEMEALPKAANANDLERVRAILASGAFTQHDLDLALARSVLRFDHRGEIARLLLEHGADPDGQYGSNYGPIIFVTGECLDVEGLKFLIAARADGTFEPLDTEVLAIHRGDANALAALLDADPSMLDRRFETMPYGNLSLTGARLIHYAAEFGEIECAALLLERGANPRLESADKRVPLHHAAHNGPRAMVELLIRYNAKTWQADQEGRLPIDYARTGVAADKDAIVHLLDRPVLDDPHFRAAVNAIHAGDLATLRQLLKDHPNLSRDRAVEPDCYPESDYFGSPKLLWFVANNPTLIKTMPDNMTEIASA
ncbi:MAG TPA: ankyrin repeat domain-containing protein, partial [Tepidisphaeraceae bacterium]|nr:ankyrin repeat domain-containing protein [Tepidisphaeraceae bacterium]